MDCRLVDAKGGGLSVPFDGLGVRLGHVEVKARCDEFVDEVRVVLGLDPNTNFC
jgi:hypothetical protein